MKKFLGLLTSLVMAISIAGVMPTARVNALTFGDLEYEELDENQVIITGCSETATELAIPALIDGKKVVSIDDWAFYDCDGLISVTVGENVKSIGEDAFYSCDYLTSFDVSESNTRYSSQDGVLFNKDKSELVMYPCGKETDSYTIPSGVTSIADRAFSDCYKLITVTIPGSVTSIGNDAFISCRYLANVVMSEGLESIGADAFAYCASLDNVTLPDTVRNIMDGAFRDCDSITNITIPDSVDGLGNGVFEDCDALQSIVFGSGLSSIGSSICYSCDSLSSVTFSDGLISIDEYAFAFCPNLTEIKIPKSVTSLSNGIFLNDEDNGLIISCYPDSEAERYAISNNIQYNSITESQLSGNIYYQLKPDKTTLRFVTEVDISDVQEAESGGYVVYLNGEDVDEQPIAAAYKAIYANGKLVQAPEGKCYVISRIYAGFMVDDALGFEMTLSNYDKGISREVII